MSAAVGGPIESVAIRGRLFAVAADADATTKLGGFESEPHANGDGTARIIKTRVPWSVTGLNVEISHDRGDQEFLQDIADGGTYVDIAVTFASSAVYQGTGIVMGEIASSSTNATATISLSGPAKLGKQ